MPTAPSMFVQTNFTRLCTSPEWKPPRNHPKYYLTALPLPFLSSLPSISSSPAPSLGRSLQLFLSTPLPTPCRTKEMAAQAPQDLACRRYHAVARRTQNDAARENSRLSHHVALPLAFSPILSAPPLAGEASTAQQRTLPRRLLAIHIL